MTASTVPSDFSTSQRHLGVVLGKGFPIHLRAAIVGLRLSAMFSLAGPAPCQIGDVVVGVHRVQTRTRFER